MTPAALREFVKDYYGKVLQKTTDLKTTACCTLNSPPRYLKEALANVPAPILDKYYGCGSPLPSEIDGLTVLDLGSGSGRDCYVASKLTGPNGHVIGVDMTEEQLTTARAHVADYMQALDRTNSNLEFKQGYIEFLEEIGVADESVDLVISNCVVNLSPDKASVIKGVARVLKSGGEFYFSDVYCDRRLPQEVREHELLYGECIAGALYIEDFKRLAQQNNFLDPRVLETSPIEVTDEELKSVIGEAKFYSITYRLFKLPTLETLCEDYGQVATYLGGIPGQETGYALDDHHYFEKGKPMLVCGNTASMVEETRLKKHFKVTGDHSVHYGLFDCSEPVGATGSSDSAGGSCC